MVSMATNSTIFEENSEHFNVVGFWVVGMLLSSVVVVVIWPCCPVLLLFLKKSRVSMVGREYQNERDISGKRQQFLDLAPLKVIDLNNVSPPCTPKESQVSQHHDDITSWPHARHFDLQLREGNQTWMNKFSAIDLIIIKQILDQILYQLPDSSRIELNVY